MIANDKSALICDDFSQIGRDHAAPLPPLNALPSFEAAARHLSFSRAADELRVTHGAVSRAVRNLEDYLGVQLMIRATRSVRLTPIGASYAAEIRAPWSTSRRRPRPPPENPLE
ncbi:LysR family transcriptional regulator [Bradyrhizobium sp. UFLA05-153]